MGAGGESPNGTERMVSCRWRGEQALSVKVECGGGRKVEKTKVPEWTRRRRFESDFAVLELFRQHRASWTGLALALARVRSRCLRLT